MLHLPPIAQQPGLYTSGYTKSPAFYIETTPPSYLLLGRVIYHITTITTTATTTINFIQIFKKFPDTEQENGLCYNQAQTKLERKEISSALLNLMTNLDPS